MDNSRELASRFGISQGSLPVKYLGLPILPHKLRPIDYQPLLDKVRGRMSGWTVRHLSFAGRLQLLKSVIHSIINLREAVFPLPNVCIDELEQICNAFTKCLHSGSARGAKVAWDSVCTRTSLDGLGNRRLKNVKIVYGVKLKLNVICTEVLSVGGRG